MPGPTIEVRSCKEILLECPNQLPTKHFLPIDHKLMGAEPDKPEVRTVVHLHGAKAPAVSDGYPENWYTPGQSAVYHYPNNQEAALLWYHDHAMGINRLNVMAGMLGLYIVRDDYERSLNLPSGPQEIPLVLTDRTFREDGQLYYPVSQRPGGVWVSEFFGDTVLLNGKILPYLEVAPQSYRFRILNASNGRFYRLSVSNGAGMLQIGTDQGFLSCPVAVKRLTLAPGERADIVMDFSKHAGERVLLSNDNRQIMQIRVAGERVASGWVLPANFRDVPKMTPSQAVKTRSLTLDEIDTTLNDPMVHLLDGKRWHDPISEKPVLGTTEIWEFINTTDDTHPIHLHLVRFQILNRQPFDVPAFVYDKKLIYTAPASSPEENEAGWKDTVRASPGAVTRIIVKFEGYAGRYVWHCHILEHEDNEMMRPYEIVKARV
jgi:spore coat protein A